VITGAANIEFTGDDNAPSQIPRIYAASVRLAPRNSQRGS
jgi:hypothetical protein